MSLSQAKINELLNTRKPRELIIRNEIDVAWAAGLFEGEGSCYLTTSQNNRPNVELATSDEDVLRRFVRIVGFGSIRKRSRGSYKPSWSWHVAGRDDVIEVLTLLLPHLGERRTREANRVIERAKQIRDYSRRVKA